MEYKGKILLLWNRSMSIPLSAPVSSLWQFDSDGHRPDSKRDDDLSTEQPDAVIEHSVLFWDERPVSFTGRSAFPNSRTRFI